MLERFEAIRGLTIKAGDDEVGALKDVLFDDQSSNIRYLVADTGGWFSTTEILLSPEVVTAIDHDEGAIVTRLSKAQIETSPPISTDLPVSRQEELKLHQHYAWEPYWSAPIDAGPALWAAAPTMGRATPWQPGVESSSSADLVDDSLRQIEDEHQITGDQHLRSAREVVGYHIRSGDRQDVGKVKDLYIQPRTWHIRYLLIDTGTFFSSKKIAIATDWLEAVDWATRLIEVRLDRDSIESMPPIENDDLSDDDERRLADVYARPSV